MTIKNQKPVAVSGIVVGKKGIHHAAIDFSNEDPNASNVALHDNSFSTALESTHVTQGVIRHFMNVMKYIKSKQIEDPRWMDILL